MFMHIFGKSDQNIVVIMSKERQTTGNIASWQRTAHGAVLSRGSNHYNSIHAKNLELDWVVGTTPTTQSSLLVGTIHTSTSLSLKYKCLLVARHMWRMRGHLKLKDPRFTPGYTTNARTQLLGANTKSSEHRSNKSESESSSSVAMSVNCCLHWFSVI